MTSELLSNRLLEIVSRERIAGCTMADESLVPVAIRRWKSYDRRHKKSKNTNLEHRALDLLNSFLEQFPEHNYDELCLKHLADSFSLVLCSSLDNRDSILDKLSPKTCPTCKSESFEAYGRVGHWNGTNGGGIILGAVCDICNTALIYRTNGIPVAHANWSIEPSPMWLNKD